MEFYHNKVFVNKVSVSRKLQVCLKLLLYGFEKIDVNESFPCCNSKGMKDSTSVFCQWWMDFFMTS